MSDFAFYIICIPFWFFLCFRAWRVYRFATATFGERLVVLALGLTAFAVPLLVLPDWRDVVWLDILSGVLGYFGVEVVRWCLGVLRQSLRYHFGQFGTWLSHWLWLPLLGAALIALVEYDFVLANELMNIVIVGLLIWLMVRWIVRPHRR